MRLRALRISQNGKPGTVFNVDEANRAKQLCAGKNPIAEELTDAMIETEMAAKAEADSYDPDIDGPRDGKTPTKAEKKGGPKQSDATGKKKGIVSKVLGKN